MAITGAQQPLSRALSYLDALRRTANSPAPAAPQQTVPQATPTPEIPDIPPEGGGDGTQPSTSGVPYYLARPDQPTSTEPQFGGSVDILDPTGRYAAHFYPPTKYHGAYGYVEDKSTGATRPMTADELAQVGGGSASGAAGSDHYATDVAAANEAANRAETIRSHRMQEAQDAINALTQRTQAAQTAKLDALPYAVGNMAYYPGLGPQSPAVSLGLADPFKVQGVAFDPNRVATVDPQQAQSDLAQLRQMAGY